MTEEGKKAEEGSSEKTDKESEPGVIKLPMVSIPVPRTFKALDKLLAYPLEGWLLKLDRERKDNIERHIEIVGKRVANDNDAREPSVREFMLFGEWAEAAQGIGDNDSALAAAWRNNSFSHPHLSRRLVSQPVPTGSTPPPPPRSPQT